MNALDLVDISARVAIERHLPYPVPANSRPSWIRGAKLVVGVEVDDGWT